MVTFGLFVPNGKGESGIDDRVSAIPRNCKKAGKVFRDEIRATTEGLGHPGHDLDKVSIGVAQECVAVVLTGVVGWLDDGGAG